MEVAKRVDSRHYSLSNQTGVDIRGLSEVGQMLSTNTEWNSLTRSLPDQRNDQLPVPEEIFTFKSDGNYLITLLIFKKCIKLCISLCKYRVNQRADGLPFNLMQFSHFRVIRVCFMLGCGLF